MSNVVYATGQEIYDAAVAGARRGYNRSTDNYTYYVADLENHYAKVVASIENKEDRRRLLKSTRKDWRRAYLPVKLALVHHHIAGEPCEAHARVYLSTNPFTVFDIPMTHWQRMEADSRALLALKGF